MARTHSPICSTERPYLVADGAMGTTLFSLGLEGGGCPEMLNIEQADLVEKVHRSFIEAGSDIILTNTFGGNRLRLNLHQLGDRVAELNRAAVEVAQRAVSHRPIARWPSPAAWGLPVSCSSRWAPSPMSGGSRCSPSNVRPWPRPERT